MAALPYATLQAGELERTTAPLAWIMDGLFLEAGAAILGGAPKTGKSFFALDLCVAIASGTSCASRFSVRAPGPVVILCAEDPLPVITARLTSLARARGRALKDLPIEVIVDSVRLPEGLARLEANLDATRPRLLLLDPLIRLFVSLIWNDRSSNGFDRYGKLSFAAEVDQMAAEAGNLDG
jgi:RecA-family ATPase